MCNNIQTRYSKVVWPAAYHHVTLSFLQCNRRRPLDAFIREVLSTDHVDVALLGCGCSAATEAVAEVIQYWNLPQVQLLSLCSRSIFDHFQAACNEFFVFA